MDSLRRRLFEDNNQRRDIGKRNTCAKHAAKPYEGSGFFSVLLSLYGNGEAALPAADCCDSPRSGLFNGLHQDPQPRYVERTLRGGPARTPRNAEGAIMRARTANRLASAAIGLMSLMAVSGAGAAGLGEVYSRLAFEAADGNGDQTIDEAELVADTAAGFVALDDNGDRRLDRRELQEPDAALFARLDRNRDGSLSFAEVLANKLEIFERLDVSKDGTLSVDEVVAFDRQACTRLVTAAKPAATRCSY